MPQHPNHVRTERLQVWVTPEGRAAVQTWADTHQVSLGAALETLARLGLGQAPQDALAPIGSEAALWAIRRELRGLRALVAATAIDAGVAMRLAGAAVRVLRPKDYPQLKQTARLETVSVLRQRDAAAELGLGPAATDHLAATADGPAPSAANARQEAAATAA